MKLKYRAAVPIRSLIFASVVVVTMLWAFVGYIGSYDTVNNVTMNTTFKISYLLATGAQTNASGLFGIFNNMSAQARSQSGSLGGLNTLNTVGMVSQYLLSIPATYTAIISFVQNGISGVLGVGISYPEANLIFLVIIIIILSIISAVFIFPI